jgi:glycosyltransferase involved in cell wall biosynthesis
LVPPKRPDLLAAEMIRVLHDETLLAELRKRAIHNIDYFTIERAAKDYLVIYEEALSKA